MQYRLPLDQKRRRFTVFTLLYLSEGLPLGFSTIALATYLRMLGSSTAEVGAFVAACYAPWAFKWAWAPLVDLFWVRRLGHSRSWILASQLVMILTMASLFAFDLSRNIPLLISLIILHNIFAATQDVAIDALAVRTLPDEEVGTANGLMFGAQYTGLALGGSGALYVASLTNFTWSFAFILTLMAILFTFVTLPLLEPASPLAARIASQVSPWTAFRQRLSVFFSELSRGLLRSGSAPLLCAIFAFFPPGAVALSLALGTTFQVDLKMSQASIATTALLANCAGGLGALFGGWCADRFSSPRGCIVASYSLTALLTLYIASQIDTLTPQHFRALYILYYFCFGIQMSAFSGLSMRLSNPAVAATQFTAYMALHNLPYSYSSAWQGVFAGKHGYAATLALDALLGLSGLLLLFWVVPKKAQPKETPHSDLIAAPFAGKA